MPRVRELRDSESFGLYADCAATRFFPRQNKNAGIPAAISTTPSIAFRGFDQTTLTTTNTAVITKSAGNAG